MLDRAAASVWVLVVDGLSEGRHVSLHATRDDAHGHVTTITATLAQRTLGSPNGPVETWTM
ncbi:hypothetical protein [Amycolatopsis sp. lyj-112]|uniref:hypothetical protein n=1 Tax=Amycolatopsis sp. lyj-112 TaxID=2789288 RepID=UPI003978BD67